MAGRADPILAEDARPQVRALVPDRPEYALDQGSVPAVSGFLNRAMQSGQTTSSKMLPEPSLNFGIPHIDLSAPSMMRCSSKPAWGSVERITRARTISCVGNLPPKLCFAGVLYQRIFDLGAGWAGRLTATGAQNTCLNACSLSVHCGFYRNTADRRS